MAEDFVNELEGDAATIICYTATVGVGAATGGLVAKVPGLVLGAILGYLFARWACGTTAKPGPLNQAIRRKLSSQSDGAAASDLADHLNSEYALSLSPAEADQLIYLALYHADQGSEATGPVSVPQMQAGVAMLLGKSTS